MPIYKRGTKIVDVSDQMTPTGFTSRELVAREEAQQQRIAESEEWQIAKELNTVGSEYKHGDSKKELERLGFTNIRPGRKDLFYSVTPPKGWTKETQGFWTTVKDEKGNERMTQFYKGAFYDERAFVNISK